MSEAPMTEARSPAPGRALKSRMREVSAAVLGPVARGLYALGVRPDHVTVLGLVLSVVAGVAFWFGEFRWGAFWAAASGLCDMLDGQLARVRGTPSRFGAFLDSTLDRAADGAILLGLAAFYAGVPARPGEPGMLAPDPAFGVAGLALLGLLGSLLVSYTRARAEGLGLDCNVGWFERPERVVLLIVAALFGVGPVMPWALVVLTILSFVTVAQRVTHVYRQTRGTGNDA